MTDYSNAIIYTIKTDDGLYVGSTIDFKDRKRVHKCNVYNENNKHYNYKVYQNIRANDGEYRIELYKPFPCDNRQELQQEEDRIRIELDANLNMIRAYTTEEEKREYKKEWSENNRDRCSECKKEWYLKNKDKVIERNKLYNEKNRDEVNAKKKLYRESNRDEINAKQCETVICECGCKSIRVNITRHRKSQKHLNLMKELDK